MACVDNGEQNIDAGKKLGASNSGRRTKLTNDDNIRIAKCLREGFGTQMTRAIINNGRTRANRVSISCVRRSAKRSFAGECRNRRTKKTGNKDPESIWCVCRHEFALQLQQQFREGDIPGATMIGKTVCKWFGEGEDAKMFVGKITEYDERRKWYKVLYSDGDEEELSFRQLRIGEWKKIPRKSVLWLDEKVCPMHLTGCHDLSGQQKI